MREQDLYEQLRIRLSSRLGEFLGSEKYRELFENVEKDLTAQTGQSPSRSEIVHVMAERFVLSHSRIEHDEGGWRIYYLPISEFEQDLVVLGQLLAVLTDRGEQVVSIIPNMGLVSASILLGTDFQGVKGLAIVTRRNPGSQEPVGQSQR